MSFEKKIKEKINKIEKINKNLAFEQRRTMKYLEQEAEGYMVAEEYEKTLKVNQSYLKENMPKYNADNIFDLELNYGSYSLDTTNNGTHLLLGGEKGHVALFDWRNKDLNCELKLNEKIRAIRFLHNETMFAVAQKEMVYIYDRQGIQLHALEYHNEPNFLEFLPYHFLLVSGLKNKYFIFNISFIKYQDISIGNIISEIRTKSGNITSMTQNNQNAVIITGHSTGVVNLWTPNLSEAAIKISAHPNTVTSLSVDPTGNNLITCGNDSKMKVWDLRNYKTVFEYFNPGIATATSFSQRGLLSVSYNNVVEVWKDISKQKQKEPYMKHLFKNNQTKTKSVKFINFEDYLGIGTNLGYSSIIIPGSGEPNFDTFENNPYRTKKQRQTSETKSLLEKIPSEMITLDSNQINQVDTRSRSIIERERKEEINKKAEEILKKQKKKLKKRLSNKESNI